MPDEILILAVRDSGGNFKDLGVDLGSDVWAARVTDPQALAQLQAIAASVDQLEGFSDGLEALEAAIRDRLPAAGAASEAKLEAVRALLAGAATEAKLEAVRALLAAALTVQGTLALDAPTLAALETVTANVTFPSDQKVHDDYQDQESLDDQPGVGSVLTFTFSAAVQLVVIESDGESLVSRATADPAETPTASKGAVCRHQVPVYIPAQTSTVKVFAPAGTTVSVFGLRRA